MKILVAILAVVACITSSDASGAATKLTKFKTERIAELRPFTPEKRLAIQQGMNELFLRLWQGSKDRKVMLVTSAGDAKHKAFLHLSDKDRDGKPEEFVYSKTEGNLNSPDFGFFFDFNGKGRVDYIIFYGGPLMAEGKKGFEMWWMNYHGIDSNDDGKVDNLLFQGSTDLNGNGMVEPGIGLWLIDDDFDGTIDRALYLGPGYSKEAAITRGKFDLSKNVMLANKTVRPGDPVDPFFNRILSDINAALGTPAPAE